MSRAPAKGPTKLDARGWGVNFGLLLWLLALAACKPPRIAPPVPAGEWVSMLGSPARSAYVDADIGDSLGIVWRKGVDRGLAVAVQIHGPILLATTTGRAVVTLNAESGMQYWSRRFAGPIAGTALRRDDRIFVATGDRENKVHAIEISRGRGLWTKRVGAIRVEPLLLDSSLVVVTESGDVVSLRTRDGSEIWRTRLHIAPAGAPVVSGNRLFVATARDTLYELNAGNGSIAARMVLPAAPASPVLLHDGRLIFASGMGELAAVDVRGQPRIEWRSRMPAPVVAAPVAIADAVFVLDRDASVWRISGGGVPTRIAELSGAASGSLTAVGRQLVVGRLDGALFVLDETGQIQWRTDMEDSVIAPVAARGGVMFVPLLRGALVRLQ